MGKSKRNQKRETKMINGGGGWGGGKSLNEVILKLWVDNNLNKYDAYLLTLYSII